MAVLLVGLVNFVEDEDAGFGNWGPRMVAVASHFVYNLILNFLVSHFLNNCPHTVKSPK